MIGKTKIQLQPFLLSLQVYIHVQMIYMLYRLYMHATYGMYAVYAPALGPLPSGIYPCVDDIHAL